MGTTWRWGVLLDERTADMLDEAQRLSGVPITCTQGSYSSNVSQSAGTHDGGGSVDLSASGLNQSEADALVLGMRQVGFAAFLRTPEEGNWPYHIHAIAGGCPDLSSGARDQWNDYLAGRNGLANGKPDSGPRDFHYVGIVWEQYLEDDMPSPQEVAAAVWAQPMNASDGKQYAAQSFLEQSNMQAENTINYHLPYDGGVDLWTVLTATLDLCKKMQKQLEAMNGGAPSSTQS